MTKFRALCAWTMHYLSSWSRLYRAQRECGETRIRALWGSASDARWSADLRRAHSLPSKERRLLAYRKLWGNK